ncbi:MAG: hypothetical protein II843_01345 [Alphaproteobacteria bacterium]|nr:hypothetical protein [Alphaproteobacteria bacterium]
MTFDEILEQNRPDQDNYDNAVAMSQRFQKATESPDFVENPFLNLEYAAKASRNPVNRVYNENDLKNITSDVGTIAWDSFRKGVMDLQSVGDKAEMAIGNTLAGISGNTLGTEMRDRAADSLMKTMEESRFVDSNYGDAETWTARIVGGTMSMGEMLAVGAATGGVGLGAYVGTLSLSDGALNDMVKYQEEHGNLDGYKTDPRNLALDYLNAVFQIATEEVGGAGRLLNGRVFKAGKTGTAILKESLINFLQESVQGAATDLTEVLKGNQDISVLSENAIGYMKDGVVAGVLGGAIGGSAYKLNKNRALQNLDKINAVINPNATPAEIREKSEEVFEKTEEKMLKSFVPELMAQNEAINDKGAIRENVRSKIASMYEDADMSEQEKAQTIEATTSLELENMLYDSIERKIPLTANPLLQGEVNELGWFRNGIPEQRRQEIENLRKEYVNLRDELKAQNESAEKDYNKIDELETKLEVFRTELPNKLQDLIVADREQIRKMLAEQRESVADSQAKKRMISAIKRKAQSAIKAQEKADTKLAEQMARGAEKAQLQREKKETAQQTKEAKIRDLQEQREIARAIKGIKLKTRETKTTQNRQLNRAIEQATDESLRGVLLKNQWQEPLVKRLTSRQLRTEVKNLPNVSINDLVPMSVREATTRQEQIESKVAGKEKTVKGYFHRKINRQFAKDSGILYAWGYSNEDPAINLVFLKDGGIDDWGEIAESLSNGGYLPDIQDSYELEDARIEQAKDIVLNRADMDLNNLDDSMSKQIDYTEDVGYDMLKNAGYTDEQIQNMSYQEMTDNLSALQPQQESQDNINIDEIPDNLMFQESFDLADENARLDDIYPEYTGDTIEVDGKERTVYNSNGDRIAKSKEALTNFWRWFGDSKVVDEQGRPLVVYHGSRTEKDFTIFDKRYQKNKSSRTGFWFGSDIIDYGQNVKKYYIKLENPFIYNANKQVYNQIEELDKTLLKNILISVFGQNIAITKYDTLLSDYLTYYAKKQGYDGVIINDIKEGNKAILMDDYVAFNPNQIKSVDNRGTYSSDTGNIYKQTQMQAKTTGGKDTYRGAYLPEYRFIAKTENMDASTLNHELAHDWGQEYFRWARSGKASESFLRSWGAVEKAIGITDNDTYFTYDASEKFARAYEGWLLQKKDWAKILKIDNDDDKKAVESMMEDYRKQLVDIYESLVESSKYFKETFGEVGELKPELVDFFERATRYDDIELREKRGEITAEQANQEKLNHLVETAVNGQVENMPVTQAQEADAIGQIQDLQETANDTERFETEGGNVKSLQRRLDRIALAQDLTQNDKDLGKYDSHRDMLAVAEQADEFVQNRRDDALAIINGEMAEQDGLYASDLYTALERVANSTGDFDLIQELRNSKIANEMAKELGQRIAGFRNYKGSGDVDVISVLNSLDKQLKTEYNKNKSTADEYIGNLVAELKSVDNNAQLDAFFDEMECR